jgi:hypothetical protein
MVDRGKALIFVRCEGPILFVRIMWRLTDQQKIFAGKQFVSAKKLRCSGGR